MNRKPPNPPPDDPRPPSNLRHDLLATVHTLVGALELLLTTRLTTRQRRYVNVCKRATESLIALATSMQDGSAGHPNGHPTAQRPRGVGPGAAAALGAQAHGQPFPRPAVDELARLGVAYVPKPVTRGPLLETIRGFGRPRPRVLLAEDSPDSCMLIQQYLRDAAQVYVVHDGKSAVEKYKAEKYDLLLIDLQMPIMDGCAAIRAIRAWETEQELPHTPIVVLTAHDLILPMANSSIVDRRSSIGTGRHDDDRRWTMDDRRSLGAPRLNEDKIIVEPDPEIAHLIPGFLAGRRHDVQTILQALTDSNYEAIRTTGHMLKGTGGGYGFDGISALGHRLEEGAERQDFEQIREAVAGLADYLDRVSVIRQAVDQPEPVHAHQY